MKNSPEQKQAEVQNAGTITDKSAEVVKDVKYTVYFISGPDFETGNSALNGDRNFYDVILNMKKSKEKGLFLKIDTGSGEHLFAADELHMVN